MLPRITPYKREHGAAFKETMKGQVWPSGGIEHAA